MDKRSRLAPVGSGAAEPAIAALFETFDHVKIGEIADVRVHVPAGIGSQAELSEVVDTGTIGWSQFLPQLFFSRLRVKAIYLDRNILAKGSEKIASAGGCGTGCTNGKRGFHISWLTAVNRVQGPGGIVTECSNRFFVHP